MPILNKHVQVVFGTGDISAQTGYQNDRGSGVVQFIEIEPRPIEEEFTSNKREMVIAEAPVTLIFNKIESLDSVIYQLQRLRDKMDEENKKLSRK